jgi:hypothetical protein
MGRLLEGDMEGDITTGRVVHVGVVSMGIGAAV